MRPKAIPKHKNSKIAIEHEDMAERSEATKIEIPEKMYDDCAAGVGPHSPQTPLSHATFLRHVSHVAGNRRFWVHTVSLVSAYANQRSLF